MEKKDNSANFIDFLKFRLKSKLPGLDAHLKMAPLAENLPFRSFTPSEKTHPSSVLILLFPENNNINENNHHQNKYNIILTLRSKKLNSHSGQISFPGGHSEDGESASETALREAYEEIGLSSDGLEVLGSLSTLYVPPSDAMITPVLSYLPREPEVWVNSSDEVEEVFKVPLSVFLDENSLKREIWNFKGRDIDVPLWDIHPKTPLWGATSMILNELLELYKEFLRLSD